ncbi:hypothetical protein [Sphingosinicella humi]|uniref:Biopolymer transporter ExbD n=1 Tax=Allosphingosinicella humi TaxID=2068657 RepID=A0A2U2J3J0_9SPHN|nr:hypothetical protein [Sphingosinicella humi]PWG02900.1 hypothetical protein DF286_08480 [Sphingosinicella humi]
MLSAALPATRLCSLRLALPFALLTACASLTRDDAVFIDVGGDNSCVIEVEGRRFALPSAEARLEAHLRRLAARTAGVVIGPRPARARPGCWDRAVALALRAGFARIGYLSDAPPVVGEIG